VRVVVHLLSLGQHGSRRSVNLEREIACFFHVGRRASECMGLEVLLQSGISRISRIRVSPDGARHADRAVFRIDLCG
jgi:hypothetical protein